MNIVIAGFGWAGYEAAITCKELDPKSKVTVISKEPVPAYCRCGLTNAVVGEVSFEDLMLKPLEQYELMGIRVLLGYEAIDVYEGVVRAREVSGCSEIKVPFDKLIIATGAEPTKPEIDNLDLQGAFHLRTLEDARAIASWARSSRHAVVYGAGFLGLQIADALSRLKLKTTIVEPKDEVMFSIMDSDVSLKLRKLLEAHGINVITSFKSGRLEGPLRVRRLCGEGFEVDCDIVVFATRVQPNVDLAVRAGVRLGETGAISVNERMETNVDNIYAAGDCVEVKELITGRPVKAQVATTAIREARIAAINALGGDERYEGTTLMALSKVLDVEIGVVGLSTPICEKLGLDVVSALVESSAKAKYYPDKVLVKLIAERDGGRIVGAQFLGYASHTRASLISFAIAKGLTVHDLANLELAYYPSITSTWDPLIVASKQLVSMIKR
ncbi:MAG: FAD-dependent oxidoreductase [Candidatus Nezhaarchaeota archaeon]|nr:FAD-dependent oxidoreductase [Candidatus Nezhaarchaeota archaeon]MCX8141466.1 FAD-dependent oxidoreductase [Candidatus Nezhaarchaeota archaeon]MDW8049732.1 FAD-dependent oxidoreductase [Nitrososphaerota archaeon]